MEHLSIPKLAERIPDEASAYQFLEQMRWGDRPVCPHCGSVRKPYFLAPTDGGRKTRNGKVSHRRVWKCADCRKQFTVLVGTVFHRTHIPVRTWVFILFDMCSAKNGISAREVQRKYELSAEAAWFALHRLREAMKRDPLAGLLRGTVVADETWLGPNPRNFKKGQRFQQDHFKREHKIPVLSLVHRESGEVRSQVVPDVTARSLRTVLEREVDLPATTLHTDESPPYTRIGWKAADHQRVTHKLSEYVGPDGATTNHAEGFFAQLKRSLNGTFHHVSREHLPRYLAEFDYRYSTRGLTDSQRLQRLVAGVGGRRLSYRPLTGR